MPPNETLAALRAELAANRIVHGSALAFDIPPIDTRLSDNGINAYGLHEVAAASPNLSDDAAATLFVAGIAARFADRARLNVFWGVTSFDLYAPGLEQVGLSPDKVLYAQGRKDVEVLAMAEDALRSSSLACVIAEVKAANMTATRRLQLAAADGQTPVLLYRRQRSRARCPLSTSSAAMTRWRVGCLASEPCPWPGVGRARWQVELVRQRNGDPFSLQLEACDATGRLALPAATADRAFAQERAPSRAA